MVGCANIMKVSQVAFYFTDQADLWWEQNRERFTNQVGFSWEAFTLAVKNKFYPVHLKKKLTQEFANLSKRSMLVDEYYQKFIELMRFAPHVVLIEEMKAHKFELGSTLYLQDKLGGFNFTSLKTLYGQAARLYEIRKRVVGLEKRR